jgi:hypothetical protein
MAALICRGTLSDISSSRPPPRRRRRRRRAADADAVFEPGWDHGQRPFDGRAMGRDGTASAAPQ